ncbi:signal peptidase I [Falsibacillus albus]|uniref:Signal peptidase I n=1 Tax=Falsibacillus albus TaxID=2478915 RepID=A0A3L7K2Y9_9BACI|nr:signal peptidase I [Falsibacillus albus]RLQ97446.1 signal peptidase I [Falsibacillus albus]
MSERSKRELVSWIKAVILGFTIVIVVKSFLFSNYVVEGKSMMPTLKDGNRLIVNKLDYDVSAPKHGDIVIFHATPTEDYVKRVIGLPGDTIEYKGDQLLRNGKEVDEPYLKAYKNQLESGQLTEDFTLKEKTGKTRVPKGMLWVMGDNRIKSSDSRMPWIGFVDMDQLVGKVSLRYYPTNDINTFSTN